MDLSPRYLIRYVFLSQIGKGFCHFCKFVNKRSKVRKEAKHLSYFLLCDRWLHAFHKMLSWCNLDRACPILWYDQPKRLLRANSHFYSFKVKPDLLISVRNSRARSKCDLKSSENVARSST